MGMSGERSDHFQLGGGSFREDKTFKLDDEREMGVRQKQSKGLPGRWITKSKGMEATEHQVWTGKSAQFHLTGM